MASLSVPSDLVAHRRPLSTHGLPRAPKVSSPNRSPQLSGLGFRHQSFMPDTTGPRSPGPLSPPMSAKSFGTFIDSEPSTPAYSPRMDYGWDGSTLVLLRPMSSSSEPASPVEPVWDMMSPVQVSTHHNIRSTDKPRTAGVRVEAKPVELEPAPLPVKRTKPVDRRTPYQDSKEVKLVAPLTPKPGNAPPSDAVPLEEVKEPISEEKSKEEKATSAPLNKLASKMKSMLRRRSGGEPKKEKKQKDYYDVDRMEDVHWTEY